MMQTSYHEMARRPLVSIVIPTFERPAEVRRTLAVIRRNLDVPYETLIMDNSREPMRLDLLPNEHYRHLGVNMGAIARNLGIRISLAPYILMLDDDSHPLPQSVSLSVAKLERAPPSVAGLIANITQNDGKPESAALPGVFVGCGALFRRDVLLKGRCSYPRHILFYGEEYWLTMALHDEGFRFDYCKTLRIRHRRNSDARNVGRIFYNLGHNDFLTWGQLTPPRYRADAWHNVNDRYHLISKKEGVSDWYAEGKQRAMVSKLCPTPMSETAFRRFALLDHFDATLRQSAVPQKVMLCGAGKLAGLWKKHLLARGVRKVTAGDFNTALQGGTIGSCDIVAPDNALTLISRGYTPMAGHSSKGDTAEWLAFCGSHGIPHKEHLSLEGAGRRLELTTNNRAA